MNLARTVQPEPLALQNWGTKQRYMMKLCHSVKMQTETITNCKSGEVVTHYRIRNDSIHEHVEVIDKTTTIGKITSTMLVGVCNAFHRRYVIINTRSFH